ncbi:TetR/AcrR family transcriptional regulator [Microbacterium sp.]|uniref:TetR/AcrR family transcriptional regulator n=1 Tax=Microbacterium sp. TaxID=51671 RepID=UPI003A8729A6
MPKISDARREERRAEILEAALRCFTRSGYQQTSMADIIRESGLSSGAIYLYFDSKTEIIRSVASGILDARRSELLAAGGHAPLSPARIVRLLAEGMRGSVPFSAVVQAWGQAAVDDDLRDKLKSVFGDLRETVRDGLERWATTRPDHASHAAQWADLATPVVISMLPGFVLQSALLEDFDPDEFLRGIDEVLPTGDDQAASAR